MEGLNNLCQSPNRHSYFSIVFYSSSKSYMVQNDVSKFPPERDSGAPIRNIKDTKSQVQFRYVEQKKELQIKKLVYSHREKL